MSVGRIINQGIQQSELLAPPPTTTTFEPPTVGDKTPDIEDAVFRRFLQDITAIVIPGPSAPSPIVVRCFSSLLPYRSSPVTAI